MSTIIQPRTLFEIATALSRLQNAGKENIEELRGLQLDTQVHQDNAADQLSLGEKVQVAWVQFKISIGMNGVSSSNAKVNHYMNISIGLSRITNKIKSIQDKANESIQDKPKGTWSMNNALKTYHAQLQKQSNSFESEDELPVEENE